MADLAADAYKGANELLRQALFPLLIIILGPPIGGILTALALNLAHSSGVVLSTHVIERLLTFMPAIVMFSYLAGFFPALIAGVALRIIACRVESRIRLITLSPFVGFVATLTCLGSAFLFRNHPEKWSSVAFLNGLLICVIGGIAALGSVLLAIILRCVPSPEGRSGLPEEG